MEWIEFKPEFNWDNIIQIVGFFGGFITFVGGIIIILYQLKKQREAQKYEHISQIKIDLYHRLTEGFENGFSQGFALTLMIIIGRFRELKQRAENGKPYIAPHWTIEEIAQQYKKFRSALDNVLITIEKYEIVSINLRSFRIFVSHKLKELDDIYLKLIRVLPFYMVSKNGISDPAQLFTPSNDIIERLDEKVKEFMELSSEIDSYLLDILTESQNALLGEFFDSNIPIREPEDKTAIVLTSKDENKLKRVDEEIDKILDKIKSGAVPS